MSVGLNVLPLSEDGCQRKNQSPSIRSSPPLCCIFCLLTSAGFGLLFLSSVMFFFIAASVQFLFILIIQVLPAGIERSMWSTAQVSE